MGYWLCVMNNAHPPSHTEDCSILGFFCGGEVGGMLTEVWHSEGVGSPNRKEGRMSNFEAIVLLLIINLCLMAMQQWR